MSAAAGSWLVLARQLLPAQAQLAAAARKQPQLAATRLAPATAACHSTQRSSSPSLRITDMSPLEMSCWKGGGGGKARVGGEARVGCKAGLAGREARWACRGGAMAGSTQAPSPPGPLQPGPAARALSTEDALRTTAAARAARPSVDDTWRM